MPRASAHRPARLALLLAAVVLLCGAGVASAKSRKPQRTLRKPLRTIRYRGYSVTVPQSWPVFHLARDPGACVRFDRNAVYLGTPGPAQRCPAHAAGRAAAILIEPAGGPTGVSVGAGASALAARASAAGAASPSAAPRLEGAATSFVPRSGAVRVTATWSGDPGVIASALHRRQLLPRGATDPQIAAFPALARTAADTALAQTATVRARSASKIYTGLGFDACSAPSSHAMGAWGSSPYRALGIYLGGANSACSQPNLTASWVSSEVATGWHFIPTYVGLQAPSNSCGCAAITPSRASAEGTGAAQSAITDAQSLGIPPGNPIYNDMETYSRGPTNSAAVLSFLSAWTSDLHAHGYQSGVYSSAGAGIADLVSRYGTGYPEPDDLWIANWNGQHGTGDPAVPGSEWANHQRIHQYDGGHNETYGGVTINIDGDYLDAATADTSGAASRGPGPPTTHPRLTVSPAADGTTNLTASWNGGSGVASWQVLAAPPQAALTAAAAQAALTTIASAPQHGSQTRITVHSAAPYFAVQAMGSSGQLLGNSATVQTPAHLVLFGHSAFVNRATGTGGIPAGCYTGATCHIKTTISSGRATIATTGAESIRANGTSILFFRLTRTGRALLRQSGARLGVRVTSRDASGRAAVANLTLIPFATAGRGPARTITQATIAQVVGMTDFVNGHGVGGILAGCGTAGPCPVTLKLSVGRTQIASSGSEVVGGGELGYLFFKLTPRGRAMMNASAGNQLGATLTLSSGGGAVARARVALVRFG